MRRTVRLGVIALLTLLARGPVLAGPPVSGELPKDLKDGGYVLLVGGEGARRAAAAEETSRRDDGRARRARALGTALASLHVPVRRVLASEALIGFAEGMGVGTVGGSAELDRGTAAAEGALRSTIREAVRDGNLLVVAERLVLSDKERFEDVGEGELVVIKAGEPFTLAARVRLIDEAPSSASPARALSGSEAFAVGFLKTLVATEEQFRVSAKCDTNQDGEGEYGGFRELSGSGAGRMKSVLEPPILPRKTGDLDGMGTAVLHGYRFRICLPDGRGRGLWEPQGGFTSTSGVDAGHASRAWCCYAWPVDFGKSGRRTFLADATGVITWTEDSRYGGERGPDWDAAFEKGADEGSILGPRAVGAAGRGGGMWERVK